MEHSSNIQQVLAQNIREARNAQNLSQQQLADMVEISVLSISNIERGTSWPKPETLEKIAEKLKIAPYQLFLNETDELAPKDVLANKIERFVHEMQEYQKDLQQGTLVGHQKIPYNIKHPIKPHNGQ